MIAPQVLEELKRAAPLFDALKELIGAFEKVGSIEQAVEESQKRLADARAFEGEFKRQLQGERDQVEQVRKTAADAVAQAQRDAEDIVTAAKTAGEEIHAAAHAAVAEKGKELEVVGTAIADAHARLSDLHGKVDSARAELDGFVARAQAKKDELRKLLEH